MNQMQSMSMGNMAGMQGNMVPNGGAGGMSLQQQQQQQQQINSMNSLNPMAKMQGMANGTYNQRRMAPYPNPQVHASQKRANNMYPISGVSGQNVSQQQGGAGGMSYGGNAGQMHGQTGNGVPIPIQTGAYGRSGPLGSGYGRPGNGSAMGCMGANGMGPAGGMGPSGIGPTVMGPGCMNTSMQRFMTQNVGGPGPGVYGSNSHHSQQSQFYPNAANNMGGGMGGIVSMSSGNGSSMGMCATVSSTGSSTNTVNPYQNPGYVRYREQKESSCQSPKCIQYIQFITPL